MPDEPKDQPKKLPTYEDIERDLGLDKMSFMSEMLRPDQHEDLEDDPVVPTVKSQPQTQRPEFASLTPEERRLIEYLESSDGRKLTQQEINLALRQAHDIGHL